MENYNTDHKKLKKGILLSTLFLVLGFLTFVGIFKLISSNIQNVNVNEEELEKNEKTVLDGDNDTQEKPQAPERDGTYTQKTAGRMTLEYSETYGGYILRQFYIDESTNQYHVRNYDIVIPTIRRIQ